MPTWTRIGDLYIDCEGHTIKLADIHSLDIDCNDPADEKYSEIDFSTPSEMTLDLQLKHVLTRKQRCVLMGLSSKRDITRAIRLVEKMRRKAYQKGLKYSSYTLLSAAIFEILARKHIINTIHYVYN